MNAQVIKNNTRPVVRFRTAPDPDACRWCGYARRGHGNTYVASVGGHLWTSPTPQQRKARMLARRSARLSAPA